MTLQSLGWSQFFESYVSDTSLKPCRVVAEGADRVLVHDGCRETWAFVRGNLRNGPESPPAVGDWVLASSADAYKYVVEGTLPRRTAIVRKAAGRQTRSQVLAANVDRVLLVTSMDQDFSVSRLERYLTLTWESGATPIIALTKGDLADDVGWFQTEAERCALGFPVLSISNVTGQGIDELRSLLLAGETIVLLGSSGVGKSTLINVLAGAEVRPTGAVRRRDGKGKHTTTNRQLVCLPSGVLLIDTPGLREVQLWASTTSVEQTFPEILELAANCRFRDCQHQGEPGCAVAAGVERGEIETARVESFHRFHRELEYLDRQSDPLAALEHKRWLKGLLKGAREYRDKFKQ